MKFVRYILAIGVMAMPTVVAAEKNQSSDREVPVIHRMRRIVVDSDAIALIGYHRKTRTLEVRFKSAAVYRYANVPPNVFQEFAASESKGHFFQEKIRGHYYYWKTSE